VTFIRRQKVERAAYENMAVEATEGEHWDELSMLEHAELVHAALDKLSSTHREVMTLRFLEDMDVQDIARVMQCSEGTAKSRLHYAKHAMRQIIEREESDHG
jgi:RNA polymerase sigma-70 factor (ECF subfamily)